MEQKASQGLARATLLGLYILYTVQSTAHWQLTIISTDAS